MKIKSNGKNAYGKEKQVKNLYFTVHHFALIPLYYNIRLYYILNDDNIKVFIIIGAIYQSICSTSYVIIYVLKPF